MMKVCSLLFRTALRPESLDHDDTGLIIKIDADGPRDLRHVFGTESRRSQPWAAHSRTLGREPRSQTLDVSAGQRY
jgi:hypothetical protein